MEKASQKRLAITLADGGISTTIQKVISKKSMGIAQTLILFLLTHFLG
ncbi:hypothetical protein JIP0899_280002 [Flavobacterium psychrophilum]|nr:hypothetical protein JIP0899_280002 [Flavobacterium psychrophilum]